MLVWGVGSVSFVLGWFACRVHTDLHTHTHSQTHTHTKTQQTHDSHPYAHQLREGALAGDAVVDLSLVQPQNLAQHARLPVEQALSGRVLGVWCV